MDIKVIRTRQDMRDQVDIWRFNGNSVALVPTMGYLHEGHASLIRAAVRSANRVVVSVFVNPTQFAPGEDLEAYPRDFEHDKQLCRQMGASAIFCPTPEEMYGDDFATYVQPDPRMASVLCGKTRPTHFRGVCTVVSKLFSIVRPGKAFFGMKDAQQLAILRKMNRDLDLGVELVACPIVRELDGLAKSSRNTYLSETERQAALCLYHAVQKGQELVKGGEVSSAKVVEVMKQVVSAEPLAKIDYVEAVDADTLRPREDAAPGTLFAMAVYIGKTRLIDNFCVEQPPKEAEEDEPF